MKILLLTAVIGFVVTEELSGEFRTLYLAAYDVKLIGEDGPLRIYVRHVLYYDNYKEMCITFYIRPKDGCQLYAVLAKKLLSATFIASSDPSATWPRSQGEDPYITGLWMFENTFSALPDSCVHVQGDGTKDITTNKPCGNVCTSCSS